MNIMHVQSGLFNSARGSLVCVGGFAELANSHGLLLNVVLGEQTRLACYHLLDGRWDHQIIDVVIGASGFPVFGWYHLHHKQTTHGCLIELD